MRRRTERQGFSRTRTKCKIYYQRPGQGKGRTNERRQIDRLGAPYYPSLVVGQFSSSRRLIVVPLLPVAKCIEGLFSRQGFLRYSEERHMTMWPFFIYIDKPLLSCMYGLFWNSSGLNGWMNGDWGAVYLIFPWIARWLCILIVLIYNANTLLF